MAKKYLKIVFANWAPRFWDVVAQPEIKWPRATGRPLRSIPEKVVYFKRNFIAHFRELPYDQGGVTSVLQLGFEKGRA